MKIVICGSMTFVKKMAEIGNNLKKINHEIILPKFTEEYIKIGNLDEIHFESVKNKINHNLIKDYFNEINNADGVLIVNEDKNEIENYIGGNSFLEMGFAHILNKKIFLLNQIPEISFKDEIEAMQPIILDGELDKIN